MSYFVLAETIEFYKNNWIKLPSVIMLRCLRLSFQVVGSVLYFTSFCLDKLGQPLLNENPQLTDGWEVPKYPQGSTPFFEIAIVLGALCLLIYSWTTFTGCSGEMLQVSVVLSTVFIVYFSFLLLSHTQTT